MNAENNDDGSGMLGSGDISLLPLSQGDSIDMNVEIFGDDKTTVIGNVKVSVYNNNNNNNNNDYYHFSYNYYYIIIIIVVVNTVTVTIIILPLL